MNYYKPFQSPCGISPASEHPSSEKVDLLLGLPVYGVSAEAPIVDSFCSPQFNTPEEEFTLTNGEKAKAPVFDDPALTRLTRGNSRTIYYKLPNLSAVSGFSLSMLLQKKQMGVRLPERIDLFVSEDGAAWQRVYKLRGVPVASDPSVWSVEYDFDKIYKASWIRLDIGTLTHIWPENFSVYGTTLIPETAVSPVEDGATKEREALFVDRYPTYEELGGIHNICLAYHCYPPEKDRPTSCFSVDEMLPYVGYYDKEGNLKDTFFDSFLFLPYSAFTYSSHYKSADGWKYYIDNAFADGKNIDALDIAAEKVGSELGVDCNIKVFLTMFHTVPTYGDFPEKFGDLDGDGVDEDLSVLENKIKVTKWMIDTQIARFNEKERKNLTLAGFYWFEEEINYENPHEFQVMFFVRDYLHSLGYKMIWIPYYQASGFGNWKELGFDVACMQPNYAFRTDIPKKRLYDNAALTKRYGLCYELEINDSYAPEFYDRYKEYLEVGIETGFMNTVKMYYQGGRTFYDMYRSKDEFARSVYDDTYLFAKEKLVAPIRLKKD
ncbi:MAG: DUF4855 domain-containing protein [Clostridia bacterium]|nr:DUF4855 domain-containing protein [Clostridia bacterium]